MTMIINRLTNIEVDYINKSLSENRGMDNFEYENLRLKHPYAIMRDDNALILSSMKHYGMHDKPFNEYIIKKFGKPEYEIDFFYELIYNEGNYTTPHKDKYFVLQTTLVLLSDEFTGGKLLINKKDIDFNKTGMYVNFDGNRQEHEVTKIESGQRRVLVIMFNKKRTSLI
jgi:hypothetical protein